MPPTSEVERFSSQAAVMASALPAVTRAFILYEILEQILSNLPIKSLAQAQSVCQNWNHMIGESSVLQNILFLRQEEQRTFLVWTRTPFVTWTNCPFTRAAWQDSDPVIYRVAKLHPLLCRGQIIKFIPELASRIYFNLKSLLCLPMGPWRKAFLTQPPCEAVQVHIHVRPTQGQCRSSFLVGGGGQGVTFETLLTAIRKWVMDLYRPNQDFSVVEDVCLVLNGVKAVDRMVVLAGIMGDFHLADREGKVLKRLEREKNSADEIANRFEEECQPSSAWRREWPAVYVGKTGTLSSGFVIRCAYGAREAQEKLEALLLEKDRQLRLLEWIQDVAIVLPKETTERVARLERERDSSDRKDKRD